MSLSAAPPPAVGFIIVTVVLAVMGGGLVIPVLPGLVKHFEGGDFAQTSHSYGWVILIFAVTQFIASPILGALSDRFGRRRVILITTAGGPIRRDRTDPKGLCPESGQIRAYPELGGDED